MSERAAMNALIPGPCRLCGDVNYPLSLGGPQVCSACDAGNFHDEGRALKRLLGLLPPPTHNERAEKNKAPLGPSTY